MKRSSKLAQSKMDDARARLVDIGLKTIEAWRLSCAEPAWRFHVGSADDIRFWHDMHDQVGRRLSWLGILAAAGEAFPAVELASEELCLVLNPMVGEVLDQHVGIEIRQAVAQDLSRGFIGEAFRGLRVMPLTRALDCWAAGLVLGTTGDEEGSYRLVRYGKSSSAYLPATYAHRWNQLGVLRKEIDDAVEQLDAALGR